MLTILARLTSLSSVYSLHSLLVYYFRGEMMESRYFLFICLILQLFLCVVATAESGSREQCASYGFNNQVLQCKTCDHVAEILGDSSEAYNNCQSCCNAEATKTEVKYKKAVLEVDKRTLPFMPELQAIVNRKKELKLQVRSRYGSARLLMFAELGADEPSEVLSVHSWNQDTFVDYLNSYLVRESEI